MKHRLVRILYAIAIVSAFAAVSMATASVVKESSVLMLLGAAAAGITASTAVVALRERTLNVRREINATLSRIENEQRSAEVKHGVL